MAGECDIQWPNISELFEQLEKNEKGGISLKCLLCMPKTNIIKASITTAQPTSSKTNFNFYQLVFELTNNFYQLVFELTN